MKTKNFLRNVIFILVIFMIFGNLNAQMRLKDKYYIGSFNCGDYNSPGIIYFYGQNSIHWSNYRELNLTLNHQYLPTMNWDYEKGNSPSEPLFIGGFKDIINDYIGNLSSIFDYSWNYERGQQLFLDRWRTNFAAYGQRSTYQAEYDSINLVNGNIRPGYGYQYTGGKYYYETFNNETVKGRTTSGLPESGGYYLARHLYENCEQVNDLSANVENLVYSDVKPLITNPPYRWYIKPRMRIDTTQIIDIQTEVVRIDILAYNSTVIKSQIIKVRDFGKDNSYSGYREIYNFLAPSPYPLSVTGAELNIGNPGGDARPSKVDYRVWWYGNVDVYLDYVRVDDEWAHFLFNPGGNDDRWVFWNKIAGVSGEATKFNEHPGFGQFSSDEFQYNNIECIVKTKNIIETATNGNLTVVPIFNIFALNGLGFTNRNFLKYDEACVDDLINNGLFKDFFRFDCYPFNLVGTDAQRLTPYPHNLTYENNDDENPDATTKYTSNVARAENSEIYNYNIQDKLEFFVELDNHGNYFASQMQIFRMGANAIKRARMQSKELIISHIDQVHSDELNPVSILIREPTNEEISFQGFLGLAYGAKQTLHFEYSVLGYLHPNSTYYDHIYGLAKPDGEKRIQNVYKYSNGEHQNKWDGVCSLDLKLKAIGDYLYPPGQPNKHKYYIDTRTVNTYPPIRDKPNYLTIIRGLNEPAQYISNIKSIKRDPGTNNWSGNYWDSEEKRYWELGFFENNPNDPDIFSEKYSHYFIAVNKRCTPETPGNFYDGDLRQLKIKFDANSSALTGFNNWKLIDPITGNTISTFDITQWVDAGIFQPGEGKLFKLVPVF